MIRRCKHPTDQWTLTLLIRAKIYIFFLFVVTVISACSSLAGDDIPATMRVQLASNATEVSVERTQITDSIGQAGATAEAAMTTAAEFNAYNLALYATLSAASTNGIPERRILQNDGGAMPLEMFDLSNGEMRFEQVGLTAHIRETDRCFDEQNNSTYWVGYFDSIYLVAVALNMEAGTEFRVNWLYEGQFVHESVFVAPVFAQYQCLALEISNRNVPLQPGNWAASILLNGEPYVTRTFIIQNAP